MNTTCSSCKYCNRENISNVGSHLTKCRAYIEFKEKFLQVNGLELLTKYQNGTPISDLEKFYKIGRNFVEKCITSLGGTLRGLAQDTKARNLRTIKRKETLKKKYGVINTGQFENSPIKLANQIPYTVPKFSVDLNEYRKDIERAARKYVRQCKTKKELPTHCEYTGIKFADAENKPTNPNDWFKRTIDHRVSVLHCYLDGWTVEQASDPSNLVFCLRYINTTKGNISEKEFLKNYLPKLKKLLLDEN
jgi:hypothetical protein